MSIRVAGLTLAYNSQATRSYNVTFFLILHVTSPIILVHLVLALADRVVWVGASDLCNIVDDVYVVVYCLVLSGGRCRTTCRVYSIWIFIVSLVRLGIELLLSLTGGFCGRYCSRRCIYCGLPTWLNILRRRSLMREVRNTILLAILSVGWKSVLIGFRSTITSHYCLRLLY